MPLSLSYQQQTIDNIFQLSTVTYRFIIFIFSHLQNKKERTKNPKLQPKWKQTNKSKITLYKLVTSLKSVNGHLQATGWDSTWKSITFTGLGIMVLVFLHCHQGRQSSIFFSLRDQIGSFMHQRILSQTLGLQLIKSKEPYLVQKWTKIKEMLEETFKTLGAI